MKLKRASGVKMLLSIVPALLLALVLQPTLALATTSEVSVAYTTDGNGAVTPTEPVTVAISRGYMEGMYDDQGGIVTNFGVTVGYIKSNPKLTPKSGYKFDYWTADVDVLVPDADNWPAPMWSGYTLKRIEAGTPISNEVLGSSVDSESVFVERNTVFTAHFVGSENPDTDTDPVPVNPATPDDTTDDSASVKPADTSTTKKALPKTGSTLPGVGIAIAFAAGSIFVAATVLLKKRSN